MTCEMRPLPDNFSNAGELHLNEAERNDGTGSVSPPSLRSMRLIWSGCEWLGVEHVGPQVFQTVRLLVAIVLRAALLAEAGLHDLPLALQQFSVR